VIFSLVIALVFSVIAIQKWVHKLIRVREFQLLANEYEVVSHERPVSPEIQAVYQRQVMDILSDLTAVSYNQKPSKAPKNAKAKKKSKAEEKPKQDSKWSWNEPPKQTSMAHNCKNCGAKRRPEDKFCNMCGYRHDTTLDSLQQSLLHTV